MTCFFSITLLFLVKSWFRDELRLSHFRQKSQFYVRVILPLCVTISRVVFDVAHCIPISDSVLSHQISCVYHFHHSFTNWILNQSFFQVVHSMILYNVLFVKSSLALVCHIQREDLFHFVLDVLLVFQVIVDQVLHYRICSFDLFGPRSKVLCSVGHRQVPQVSHVSQSPEDLTYFFQVR